MINVPVYYKEPITLGAWRRRFNLQLPESWNEATPKFWLAFATWLIDTPSGEKLDALYKFLYDALPLPNRILKTINRAQANDIISALPFLKQTVSVSNVALAKIKVGPQIWSFGEQQLHNMTVGQFIACEHFYKKYTESKEIKYLDEIVAILYRPIADDGLPPLFSQREVINRVPLVAKDVSLSVKRAVFLNFVGMLNYLSTHPYLAILFPKQKDEMTLSSITQQNQAPADWAKIIWQISGEKISEVDVVEAAPTFYFMKRLADKMRDDREQRRKNKSKI